MNGKCPWCGGITEEWLEIDLAENERARARCLSCDWRYTERVVFEDGLSTDR